MAAGGHGLRQVRTRRQAGLRFHRGEKLRSRQSPLSQAFAYLAHARAAAFALCLQFAEKGSGGGIYPQSQHVDGLRAPGGGDFNAGDEAQAMHPCTMFRLFETRYGIVIRERQGFDPGGRGARHQFGGRQ